jgi:hypothetical protein
VAGWRLAERTRRTAPGAVEGKPSSQTCRRVSGCLGTDWCEGAGDRTSNAPQSRTRRQTPFRLPSPSLPVASSTPRRVRAPSRPTPSIQTARSLTEVSERRSGCALLDRAGGQRLLPHEHRSADLSSFTIDVSGQPSLLQAVAANGRRVCGEQGRDAHPDRHRHGPASGNGRHCRDLGSVGAPGLANCAPWRLSPALKSLSPALPADQLAAPAALGQERTPQVGECSNACDQALRHHFRRRRSDGHGLCLLRLRRGGCFAERRRSHEQLTRACRARAWSCRTALSTSRSPSGRSARGKPSRAARPCGG